MKHFEASGLWYPTDDPDNSVGGTLKFDDAGLQLILLGAFRQGWSPEVERYHLIRGVTGKTPYGSFVTLVDNFRTGQTFNMIGATTEKIRSNLALVGDFHLPDGPVNVEKLILGFSYLKEWAGKGGIEVKTERFGDGLSLVINYAKPKNMEFPFGDKTLTLGFSFEAPRGLHHASIAEEASIVIEPVGDITAETLIQDYVRTIQDLISFATDTPNAVEKITFRGEQDGGDRTQAPPPLRPPIQPGREERIPPTARHAVHLRRLPGPRDQHLPELARLLKKVSGRSAKSTSATLM